MQNSAGNMLVFGFLFYTKIQVTSCTTLSVPGTAGRGLGKLESLVVSAKSDVNVTHKWVDSSATATLHPL